MTPAIQYCKIHDKNDIDLPTEMMRDRHPQWLHKISVQYNMENALEALQKDKENFPQNSNQIVGNLYRIFKDKDCYKVELKGFLNESQSFFPIGATLIVDDFSSFRQEDTFKLRKIEKEDPQELEAQKSNLVFIKYPKGGNIGTLVNGAGLAMSTIDLIEGWGGKPTNFLDAGGKATPETIRDAFKLILENKDVKGVIVNVFGGIIQGDMIANGVIMAVEELDIKVPVVVRIKGTNEAEGQRILGQSKYSNLIPKDNIHDAVKEIIKQVKGTPNSSFVRKFYRPEFNRGRRTFSTSKKACDYPSTIKNLLIDENTRLLFQGFTGKAATANAKDTIDWGTNVVGGVSPGKGGMEHLGRPVFSTVKEAVQAVKPTATLVYVAAHVAHHAILESIKAEIPLIVSVAEGVPVHSALMIHAALSDPNCKSRLVGPNCPGIINPSARVRIGIMPHLSTTPGCVGIVAKSGTLSYEAIGSTTAAGLGQSLSIGVGGDYLPGTTFVDGLRILLEHDDKTKAVVLIGEIGGQLELEAAEYIKDYYSRVGKGKGKPIVAFIAGTYTLYDRIYGHAGAVWRYASEAAEIKVRALENAGCRMLSHAADAGPVLKEIL